MKSGQDPREGGLWKRALTRSNPENGEWFPFLDLCELLKYHLRRRGLDSAHSGGGRPIEATMGGAASPSQLALI
ncbi:unnamed protein product [Caenorhabditis auriculariae]|uniref:Uncharacterized protein n=1 Tax=Caenorhabditis auriculariae TaxID=2777116 RepID=A0A8S1HM02_9PELO|nr:unnamed protein product [Caenorhabditis auriculariae]